MKKILALTLTLVMVVGLFAGCGNSSGTSTSAPDPTGDPAGNTSSGVFKIGATAPLTGGASVYGTAAKNGAQIAVEEINAFGGIQFELRYEDDEHDAEKAINAYNAVKDWGMQISLGSVTTVPSLATSVENYEDRIFALTPSASAVEVTTGKDNVFQMCFSDPNQGSASAQYIYDKGLGTKISVIYKNDDAYSVGIYETFIAKAAELGLDIVSTTTFTADSENDFSVQLTDAKNYDSDLVFLPIYCEPASLIFQQAKAMDYSPKYFGVDGMDGILTLEGFDTSLAEGVMLLTPFNADADDSRTQAFVSRYQELYGVSPNQFAADGYDCVYAIYQAILNDGAISPESSISDICEVMITQFTSMSFDGLTGDGMTWDANGQVSKSPKGMVIQNGAYVGLD